MAWADYVAALRVWRRASIIEMTGWDFETLDRQPREEVEGLLLYVNTRAKLQKERQTHELGKRGASAGGRGVMTGTGPG